MSAIFASLFLTNIRFLQAVMKMIKHSHEESTGNMEVAQGALLGLVVENCLEITNCFPFPKHNDESMDEGKYITHRLYCREHNWLWSFSICRRPECGSQW